MTDVKDILEGWEKEGVAFVRFELPDMHGISRSKTIPIAHASDYAERGLNMYGGTSVLDSRSDVVGGTLYHEEVGYGDHRDLHWMVHSFPTRRSSGLPRPRSRPLRLGR